jgi:hypothetical protein
VTPAPQVVITVCDSASEAMIAGRERFGQAPFLVQEIQPFVRRLRWGSLITMALVQ